MKDRLDDVQEEPPLDPAMERVQAKLRRLILVSGSTLMIGFLAVIVAVIFRVSQSGNDVPDTWRNTVDLPAGITLVATDVDGSNLAVTVDGPEGRTVHVYHMPTGDLIGSTTLIAR